MTYSVSVYLDILNRAVSQYDARIVGETLEVKIQGGYAYFSLLDPENRSVLRVMAPRAVLDFAGIELVDGIAIAVTGHSDIYKPRGTLTFKADMVELVGEGALKKQYDLLKKKLTAEGLFDESRKRPIPEYPTRIGLLTSKTGAVIHDFQSNLGRFGYRIFFKDIRVEGAQAVPDILSGLKRMKREDIDVLVLIRGGGSMESLQAFNHEEVVRAISGFPIPVICAIGHDKDIPLAQLAADSAPSTPTACTEVLNRSWREARHDLVTSTHALTNIYEKALRREVDRVIRAEEYLVRALARMSESFSFFTRQIEGLLVDLGRELTGAESAVARIEERIIGLYRESLRRISRQLSDENALLVLHNPTRQLKLGFSILSYRGRIVRTIRDLPEGVDFEATLSDGTLEAKSKGPQKGK
jgi:exodeoxyribonuclease VII large subunit